MKIISIVNQKGGTGKTTTCINLGRALAIKNKAVLLIDLDPQSNLTFSLGIDDIQYNSGEMIKNRSLNESGIIEREEMHVIPSSDKLAELEFDFIREDYPFTILKDVLEEIKDNYDFILIDCPPHISYLTASALVASDEAIIPMQMDVLSIQGLDQVLVTIEEVKESLNPDLSVLGIVGVLVDERRHLTYEVLEYVRDNYNINVFNNYVRNNVRAAEAPSHGMSVIEYAPKSNSANDYKSVAGELLDIVS